MTIRKKAFEFRKLWIWLALGLVIAGVLVAHQVALDPLPVLARQLREALHAVGFAALAGVLLLGIRAGGNGKRSSIVAVLGCFLVAVIAEGIQVFGPRDADLDDLASDGLGILTGVLVMRLWLGDFRRGRTLAPLRNFALVGAAVLSAAVLAPLVDTIYAMSAQRAALPVLAAFDSRWEKRLYAGSLSHGMKLIPTPQLADADAGRSALLNLGQRDIPGLELFPFGDWRSYESLVFDVKSAIDRDVSVGVRVHDVGHNNEWDDRFGYRFVATTEKARIVIPIAEIEKTPSGRRLNMAMIEAIIFFSSDPTGDERIYVDNIRLD